MNIQWQPIETVPPETPILIKAKDMIVEAIYFPLESSFDPFGGIEYDGHIFSCFDDEFQIEPDDVQGWIPHPEKSVFVINY